MIVATRLRKGSANSARGAARLVADALNTTTSCGVGGTVVLRADSAYYGARRHRRRPPRRCPLLDHRPQGPRRHWRRSRRFPVTAWTTIRYPKAVFDEELDQWVSDAEVAETCFTAFASKRQNRTGHRPADRPAGPRRQPRPRHRQRAGRTVPGLAAPRRFHRLTAADARRLRPTTAATRSSNRSSPT